MTQPNQNAKKQKTIVLISGTSDTAQHVLADYTEQLKDYRIFLIEERPDVFKKLWHFLIRRVQRKGIFSALDSILLRAQQMLRASFTSETRQGKFKDTLADLIVKSLNDLAVIAAITKLKPDYVILNITSLVNRATLKAISCPVINVHNGVNPRYRGAGNIWAMYEDNFDLVGVTVHEVDPGIDTGRRIAVEAIDIFANNVSFDQIDRLAFRRGAKLVVQHIHGKPTQIQPRFAGVCDGYYPIAGLSAWRLARHHYRQRRKNHDRNVEQKWKDIFICKSTDENLSIGQRMLWQDDGTLKNRDNLIRTLLKKYQVLNSKILDMGCGDGRYANYIGKHYIGCDYTRSFVGITQNRPQQFVVADALNTPFASNTFDAIIAIGLFQHIDKAQMASDGIMQTLKPGGFAIINTLRKPSMIELLAFFLLPPWNKEKTFLVKAVFQNHYSPDHNVARRYSKKALKRLFDNAGECIEVCYNGFLGSSFLAREITIVVQKKQTKTKPRLTKVILVNNDG